jgi:hypothetical protein
MKRYLVSCLALVLLANLCRADEEVKPIKVPFELLKSHHIAVMVKINGKGPYRLIFDTGAPFMLMSGKIAKESGVLPKNFKRPLFALFGVISDKPFKVESLEIGDVKARGLLTMVMDHPTVKALAEVVGPLEGIVGFSFFARYKMTIDYQAKELTFIPTRYEPPADIMKSMEKMMMAIAAKEKPPKKVLAPAAQWGFRVTKEAGDQEAGVLVKEVLPGSAAAAAGLQEGDRLLTLDDRWTDTVLECYTAASFVLPGTEARLRIQRKGKEMELKVRPQKGL